MSEVKDTKAGGLLIEQVKTKKFGKNGSQLSSIGYGCMGLSGAHGKQKPDEERYAILDHVYQSGCRFWDSADVYADNEDLLGKYCSPWLECPNQTS